MQQSALDNVRIVLVGTTHPGNIGAAARAMKTMGFTRLSLVAPRVFPGAEATARAAGADDVLAAATLHETLAAAVADCGQVYATSARLRRQPSRCSVRAMTDEDVRHLVLDSSLDVLPILMTFERHRRLELPLDNVDPEVVGQWIDDRILEVVRTYLQMHQNAYYLKGHLVTDPIANVQFPKYAAGATLERNGKTIYFMSDRDGSAGVYAMNSDGTGQRKIADGSIVTNPFVSPDGKQIAYTKEVNGKWGLYIYEIAGGKERLLIGG